MANIGRMVVDLVANTAQFRSGLQQAERQTKAFQGSIGAFSTAFKSSIGVFGAAAVIGGMQRFIRAEIDAIEQLDNLSASTGIAADKLAALNMAANEAGLPFDTIGSALQRFNANAGKANAEASKSEKAFKNLGISAEELNSKSPWERLKLTADAISAIPDPARQAAAAMDLFGKSGARMLPILKQGGAGLEQMAQRARELGIALDGVQLDKMREADAAMDRLGSSWAGLKRESAVLLSPVVKQGADELSYLVKVGNDVKDLLLSDPFRQPDYFSEKAKDSLKGLGNIITFQMPAGWGQTQPIVSEKDAAALEEYTNKMQRADEIIEQSQTPLSKYVEGRKELDTLYKDGLLPLDVYTKKSRELLKTLKESTPEGQASLQRMREGAQLTDETRTPAERYNATLGQYKTLLEKGAISQDTYTRAVAKAREEYERTDPVLQKLAERQRELESRGAQLFEQTRTPAERYQQQIADITEMLNAGVIDRDVFGRGADSAYQTMLSDTGVTDYFDKLKNDARSAYEETRTPAERFQSQAERLNELLATGAIDLDTYGRAWRKYAEEVESAAKRVESSTRGSVDYGSINNMAINWAGGSMGGGSGAYNGFNPIHGFGEDIPHLGTDKRLVNGIAMGGRETRRINIPHMGGNMRMVNGMALPYSEGAIGGPQLAGGLTGESEESRQTVTLEQIRELMERQYRLLQRREGTRVN
jgi:hypothetical protein